MISARTPLRRFKRGVWDKYYQLLNKTDKDYYDLLWLRMFRAKLKEL